MPKRMAIIGGPITAGDTYYVSSAGSDSAAGTLAAPFLTLQRAADVARASGRLGVVDVTITWLTDLYGVTLRLTDADSGTASHPVTYRGATSAKRLYGGVPVTGWSVYSGSIQRAAVSGNFWTMYENGIRGLSARSPELVINATYPVAPEPFKNTTGVSGSHTTLTYNPADIDPTGWAVADLQLVTFSGYNATARWFSDTTPVATVNTSTNTITVSTAQPVKSPLFFPGAVAGATFYLQGALELLTQAGEWYYDRNDVHGSPGGGQHYLYYWPRATPIASQEIIVPTTQDVVRIEGASTSSPAKWIRFDRATIGWTDFTSWFRYGLEYDHVPTLPGTAFWPTEASLSGTLHAIVYLNNVENCAVTNSHLTCAGMDGIFGYQWCKRINVTGTWMDHLGYNGIHMEGQDPATATNVNGGHYLDNIKITDYGELVFHGGSVWFANVGDSNISHFEFARGSRQAISFSANGTYPTADFYTRNNTIEYGYIHEVCQDSGDTGAIDFVAISSIKDSGVYNVNRINQVLIVTANKHPNVLDTDPYGVFFDNETAGQILSNVEVRTTTGAGIGISGSSGNHTLSNYTGGSFSAGLMDYPNIGTRPGFPW